jgi:rRNA maturation protein Rpf1
VGWIIAAIFNAAMRRRTELDNRSLLEEQKIITDGAYRNVVFLWEYLGNPTRLFRL